MQFNDHQEAESEKKKLAGVNPSSKFKISKKINQTASVSCINVVSILVTVKSLETSNALQSPRSRETKIN